MENPSMEEDVRMRRGEAKDPLKGLANIYKLVRTHLAVRVPASANYYFNKHRVSTMGHIEESGSQRHWMKSARTSQIQERKTEYSPEGGSGQQGHDSEIPPLVHLVRDGSLSFSNPAPCPV